MRRDLTAALAEALRVAITRNPGLSRDKWACYAALLAEYDAAVAE